MASGLITPLVPAPRFSSLRPVARRLCSEAPNPLEPLPEVLDRARMRVGPEVRMRSARIGLALIAALAARAAAGEGGMGLRSAAPDAPVFSARLYGAPFAVIAIVPNPIVTACYKATPEYTYLYTPAGMVGAPPAMRLHNYGADTRYLLSPLSAHNTGASAYRWKGSPLYQHELGPNSGYALANRPAIEGRRGRDRPAVARNPGQKIDTRSRPISRAGAGSQGRAPASATCGSARPSGRPPGGASGANHPRHRKARANAREGRAAARGADPHPLLHPPRRDRLERRGAAAGPARRAAERFRPRPGRGGRRPAARARAPLRGEPAVAHPRDHGADAGGYRAPPRRLPRQRAAARALVRRLGGPDLEGGPPARSARRPRPRRRQVGLRAAAGRKLRHARPARRAVPRRSHPRHRGGLAWRRRPRAPRAPRPRLARRGAPGRHLAGAGAGVRRGAPLLRVTIRRGAGIHGLFSASAGMLETGRRPRFGSG